jgi:DNA-binding response OmpR family regulator
VNDVIHVDSTMPGPWLLCNRGQWGGTGAAIVIESILNRVSSLERINMNPAEPTTATRVVALFNSSADTVHMVKRMLDASGITCLAGCHFADLKKGHVDFGLYLDTHHVDVVILDITPPYAENWQFFKTLRDHTSMASRGLVLTTTNKQRLDEAAGADSEAIEIVGKPYDLHQIRVAIDAAMKRVRPD